jgi:peptidoglycan/LPS O-acetylase OafA/YrhL
MGGLTISKYVHQYNLNNFDLIRLFAAIQVAIVHGAEHLDYHSWVIELLNFFPGVPIFFFISGFLIYRSYNYIGPENIRQFYIHRYLRIFPALYLCFIITLISLYTSGYLGAHEYTISGIFWWALNSLTFLQFYNPDFLRDYGVGVVNGSLWTISVELQFYFLTPFIYWYFKKLPILIWPLILIFALINFLNFSYEIGELYFRKILNVSFLPWMYMFLLGASFNASEKLRKFSQEINIWIIIIIYLLAYVISKNYGLGTGNSTNIFLFLILAVLIFKLAYIRPKFSSKILNNHDISYGIYIYHMPVVNFIIYCNYPIGGLGLLITIVVTFFFASLSWFILESKVLNFKMKSSRNLS